MSAFSVTGGYQGTRYGAIELQQSYRRYWYIGLCLAAIIHFLVVACFYLHELLSPPGSHHTLPEPPYSPTRTFDIVPPPSIAGANRSPAIAEPGIKPKRGVPVPVPDPTADPDVTLARNSELYPEQVTIPGEGTPGDIIADPVDSDDVPPPPFIVVEKDPVPVRRIQPAYPELAIRSGIQGKVTVNLWVDRHGKVRQVVVLKSDAEIFEQPTIEAARQWVFTPAYTNNGAVAVWVSIPFRFSLSEGEKGGQ